MVKQNTWYLSKHVTHLSEARKKKEKKQEEDFIKRNNLFFKNFLPRQRKVGDAKISVSRVATNFLENSVS